jgi:CubicO group peptidase (beta-lactamase class C family)
MSPFADLAGLIEAKMAEYGVPGVAFGVCKNGHTRICTFGVTHIADPRPLTPDTVFPIASISKCITATAVMCLVEQGRAELNTRVQRYLPDFRGGDDEASRSVTLWYLLTHSAGWEGQLATENRADDSLASLVEGLRDVPQLADPGSVWSYNNTGFGVAGRVIEIVTGRSIHEALRDLVFAPLDLQTAFTRTSEVLNQPLAMPHRQNAAGTTEALKTLDLPANVTAGGAAMTLSSVLEFGRLH